MTCLMTSAGIEFLSKVSRTSMKLSCPRSFMLSRHHRASSTSGSSCRRSRTAWGMQPSMMQIACTVGGTGTVRGSGRRVVTRAVLREEADSGGGKGRKDGAAARAEEGRGS